MRKITGFLILSFLLSVSATAQKPRARDIGIPFDGQPGKFNAITDVPGVEVGFKTFSVLAGKLSGSGKIR